MSASDALNPVVPFASRKQSRVEPVDFRDESESDTPYESEPMTKADEAEMRESIHALLLSNTALNRAVAQRIDQPPAVAVATTAARTPMDRAAQVIPTFLMCATILYSFANTKGTVETDLKAQVVQAQRDATRAAQNVLLLDTYNRELERALIKQGKVQLPPYPTLEK